MSGQSIIVRDDSKLSITFSKEADALKVEALAISALIGKVTNAAENEQAVKAQAALHSIISGVEKARKEAKAPVNEFGKRIDAVAAKFVDDELKPEELRIMRLVSDFAQLEQAKLRAAEQVRIREEQRIEAERQSELARIAAEEAGRNQKLQEAEREAQRLAAMATSVAEKAKAEALRVEVEKQRALAAAQSHEALDAVNAHFDEKAAAMPTLTAPIRAEGQIVRQDWDVVVSDIWLLAKAHPTCVKIEPRISEIKELLRLGVQVRGVTARAIIRAGVRSAPERTAIEV